MAERVFNAFTFENEYFRSVQFEVFANMLRIFEELKEIPTFPKLYDAINHPERLSPRLKEIKDRGLKSWLKAYTKMPVPDRSGKISGLSASLNHFAFGETAPLFNTATPHFSIDEALDENLIVYFQLPVLLKPFLGKATGKMILQCLQGAIANRHRGFASKKFFSVFLDDFTEYLYEGFVSVLNKSRSANVGIVFAHQALGDIKTLGEPIANSILTNANMKICMRCNDPDSAEYFSKVVGTSKAKKLTERVSKGVGFSTKHEQTGEASSREVEEFKVHPNLFKSELGVGQAVMVVPHAAGSKAIEIQFKKFDDLPALPMPQITKSIAESFPIPILKKKGNGNEQPEARDSKKVQKKRAESPPTDSDSDHDVPTDYLVTGLRNGK